jgi:hypothetical protein
MIRSLRKKIFFGYGIALALMIVVFVWALVHLLVLGEASDAILRENYKRKILGVASTLLTDLSKPSGANAEWLKMKIKYNKTGNQTKKLIVLRKRRVNSVATTPRPSIIMARL